LTTYVSTRAIFSLKAKKMAKAMIKEVKSEDTQFSSVPISVALLYTVSIDGKFFPYGGIGIAYYPLKIKDSWKSTYELC
jgi:opacity protein-like surface antigen